MVSDPKKMKGKCRLCGSESDLKESHIIPSFVYKWLKATSGTGFIRFGQNPNLRTQDGYKIYWLCNSCEGLFNTWETEFSKKVFHPLTSGDGLNISYGPWLLKFVVSVSWRVLGYFAEELGLDHYPEVLQNKASNALSYWQDFLLGKAPHPHKYEQHLLPLGGVASFSYPNMPPNINRYMLRTVDIDTVHSGDESAYVYSKMGSIVLIGFIEMPHPKQWKGSKLHVKKGELRPRHYTLPRDFGDYIMNKARRLTKIQNSMSPAQDRKIEETYSRNLERAANSETIKAMDQDVKLFGDKAFTKENKKNR